MSHTKKHLTISNKQGLRITKPALLASMFELPKAAELSTALLSQRSVDKNMQSGLLLPARKPKCKPPQKLWFKINEIIFVGKSVRVLDFFSSNARSRRPGQLYLELGGDGKDVDFIYSKGKTDFFALSRKLNFVCSGPGFVAAN